MDTNDKKAMSYYEMGAELLLSYLDDEKPLTEDRDLILSTATKMLFGDLVDVSAGDPTESIAEAMTACFFLRIGFQHAVETITVSLKNGMWLHVETTAWLTSHRHIPVRKFYEMYLQHCGRLGVDPIDKNSFYATCIAYESELYGVAPKG